MSIQKKKIRDKFNDAVFKRDRYKCAFCSCKEDLDAHHITDRNQMPNGGYVKENGITLCHIHHLEAEVFHQTGTAHPGMAPKDLYKKIGSSYEKAVAASERLVRE